MTIATAPPHPLPVRTRRRWAGWTAVLLTSLAIAAYSVTPYLTSSLQALTDEGFGLASAYVDQPAAVRAAFSVHVVGGGLALLLGPWQFWAGLRPASPARAPVDGPHVPDGGRCGRGGLAGDGAVQQRGLRGVLRVRHARRPVALDGMARLPGDPLRRRPVAPGVDDPAVRVHVRRRHPPAVDGPAPGDPAPRSSTATRASTRPSPTRTRRSRSCAGSPTSSSPAWCAPAGLPTLRVTDGGYARTEVVER